MKNTFILIVSLLMITSCSKENDDPSSSSCSENFYKLKRRLILQEDFSSTSNNWNLVAINEMPECDSLDYCTSKIDNGLTLKNEDGFCSCQSNASWSISSQNIKYIAAEVKFEDFAIDMGWSFQGTDKARNSFSLALNGIGLVIGPDVGNTDIFEMNLGGHTVHFLLDIENKKVCAFSDSPISFVGGQNPPIGIVGNDISAIVKIVESNENEIKFNCNPGFGDVDFNIPGNILIKSVILYEPLF